MTARAGIPDFPGDAVPVGPHDSAVFAYFGLGVLELTVGEHVHSRARRSGELAVVERLFHDLERHRSPAAEEVSR